MKLYHRLMCLIGLHCWKDDKGNIRGEAMVFCRSVDTRIFKGLSEAKIWAAEWLVKIN